MVYSLGKVRQELEAGKGRQTCHFDAPGKPIERSALAVMVLV